MSNNAQHTRPANRQELYDRIRQTSKDEFILEDMKRLGFWLQNDEAPSVPEQLIKRESLLHRELNALVTEKRRVEDTEALLKKLRKERMLASRQKREENKKKYEEIRLRKSQEWKENKSQNILYAGAEVSEGLNNALSDTDKLQSYGLPLMHTAKELAQLLGITVNELRFLTFNRKVSRISHYRRFFMKKKTGGLRLISAPMYRLKDVQHRVLNRILVSLSFHEAAHGFTKGRSILTNARPHIGRETVINFDLKDFFPSISFKRVKGLFASLGYSEAVAAMLALICTEANVDEAELDGETWFVQKGERCLPQGAPTSPVITNLLCRTMDKRLEGLARKFGFEYSRYADDMTFSCKGKSDVNKLKFYVDKIVSDEGFMLHPDKTRIMRKGNRREVTGIVVNEKAGIDKRTLKKFRALLHRIETNKIQDIHWGKNGSHIIATIKGYANYVSMVDPEKGKLLKQKIQAVMPVLTGAYGKPERKQYPARRSTEIKKEVLSSPGYEAESSKTVAKRPWWQFWKK